MPLSDLDSPFSSALHLAAAEDPEPCRTERGVSLVYRIGPRIVVSRARGYIQAPHIKSLIEFCDRRLAQVDSLVVVHDWFGVTSYDSEVRLIMTPWAIGTRSRHEAILIGVHSKLVRMGISVVALASRAPITTHVSMATLGAALERHHAASRETAR